MDKKAAMTAMTRKEGAADQQVVEAEDEGHIELVLRVLASMCDGQNTVLQVFGNCPVVSSCFALVKVKTKNKLRFCVQHHPSFSRIT